jgi:hypothetical protein
MPSKASKCRRKAAFARGQALLPSSCSLACDGGLYEVFGMPFEEG